MRVSNQLVLSTTPHRTLKKQSSPGRGGKTFEKHDVFRERAKDGESAFYHPVLENFGSNTELARQKIMTQQQVSSIIEIMVCRDPTYSD